VSCATWSYATVIIVLLGLAAAAGDAAPTALAVALPKPPPLPAPPVRWKKAAMMGSGTGLLPSFLSFLPSSSCFLRFFFSAASYPDLLGWLLCAAVCCIHGGWGV
jgi:hypothetical protein